MSLIEKALSSGIKEMGVAGYLAMNERQREEVRASVEDDVIKAAKLSRINRLERVGLDAYAKRYKGGAAEIAATLS